MTLRPSQIETLRAVASFPDGVSAGDLGSYLGISWRAAERRIERLAAAELVDDMQVRYPFSRSGWITLAVLTEKGAACVGAVGG